MSAQETPQPSPQRIAGQRIRRRRIEAGLTIREAAIGTGIKPGTWSNYEHGSDACPLRLALRMAQALGLPVASLLVDDTVLAEIRVSDETLQRVRDEGMPAANQVAERIAANLAALLLAEATRPPVDLSPGARAKPRRTREELLAARDARIHALQSRREEQRTERKRRQVIAEEEGGGRG